MWNPIGPCQLEVDLYCVKTGEAVTVRVEHSKSEGVDCDGGWHSFDPNVQHDDEFWWSEGNMSCSCNRISFFMSGKEEHKPCGEGDVEFPIRIRFRGEVVYQEDAWREIH